MKITKTLFTLCLLMSLMACGGDDDAAAPSSDGIQGTWSVISLVVESEGTTTFSGMTTNNTTNISGSNMNYTVTFEETNWNTSGDYTINYEASANGSVVATGNDSYTNVTGNGTYSTTENVIMVNGSFFDFEIDGLPVMQSSGPQEANYEINAAGNLVISQNETTTSTDQNITTTTTSSSTSIWERQ